MDDAIFITGQQYTELASPEFMGQTRPDPNGNYKMYWKSDSKFYYTQNNLFT